MIETKSAEETRELAAKLARYLRAGDVVALSGPLGAGKTVFAAGLAAGLGITATVTSPSFVIAKHYPGNPGLLHVDAYRLACAAELEDLAVGDWAPDCVWAVEWAEKVAEALPAPRVEVALAYSVDGRRIELRSKDPRLAAAVAEVLAC